MNSKSLVSKYDSENQQHAFRKGEYYSKGLVEVLARRKRMASIKAYGPTLDYGILLDQEAREDLKSWTDLNQKPPLNSHTAKI